MRHIMYEKIKLVMRKTVLQSGRLNEVVVRQGSKYCIVKW